MADVGPDEVGCGGFEMPDICRSERRCPRVRDIVGIGAHQQQGVGAHDAQPQLAQGIRGGQAGSSGGFEVRTGCVHLADDELVPCAARQQVTLQRR